MKRTLLVTLLALAACSSRVPEPTPVAPAATPAPLATATTAGTVETKTFHSDALGVDKRVAIYLPAGYAAAPAKHYPVYYYLHGLGGDETNWLAGGKLDQQADQLGLQAIVVMPDGDDSFYTDSPTPIDYDECMKSGAGLFFPQREHKATCVRTPRYEAYITKDLVGWVDATYRTLATREGRGIAGLSMGGYGALMLGLRHPDEFAAAASHSGVVALLYAGPHPYVAGQARLIDDPKGYGRAAGNLGEWIASRFGTHIEDYRARDPATLVAKLEPGTLALYLDCGTEDDFKLDDSASYVHDLLVARHIEHTFFLGPGAHNFGFWGPRLPMSLAFMRAHVAAAK